jgi:hypothetical protein
MLDRELGSEWEGEDISGAEEKIDEGKGLFLSLSFLVMLLFSVSMAFIWYMVKPRLIGISPYLYTMAGITAGVSVFYAILKFIVTVLSVVTGKNLLPFLNINSPGIVILICQYAIKIGKVLGISIDRIGNSFVNFNNSLMRVIKGGSKNERLLVLLPRCIQNSKCKQKVAEDINNCRDCGKCVITEFKALSKEYRFHINVATGGSLARKMVYKLRPSSILAVACERELVSGIQDTGSIRVFAIPNLRPEGPCKNTTVDMDKVRDAIKFIYDNKNENLSLDGRVSGAIVEAGARG